MWTHASFAILHASVTYMYVHAHIIICMHAHKSSEFSDLCACTCACMCVWHCVCACAAELCLSLQTRALCTYLIMQSLTRDYSLTRAQAAGVYACVARVHVCVVSQLVWVFAQTYLPDQLYYPAASTCFVCARAPVCVCVCVCVYTYMWVYIHTYVCECVCAYIHICVYMCVRVVE